MKIGKGLLRRKFEGRGFVRTPFWSVLVERRKFERRGFVRTPFWSVLVERRTNNVQEFVRLEST